MRTLIFIMIMVFITPLQGVAQVQRMYYSQLPNEESGYMVRMGIDNHGRKVFIKTPVVEESYAGGYSVAEYGESENLSYRDCRIELSRAREAVKSGSVMRGVDKYPLYLDY